MEKVVGDPFGHDVEFPTLPAEEVPEDMLAIRRMLAGQRALRALHAKAADVLGGDAAFLARLIRKDWESSFGELLASGEDLLALLGSKEKEEDMLPPRPQVEKIAAALRGASGKRVLEVLSVFASKSLISTQLVPWVSDVEEVFIYFQRCCEAEDRHFSVLDLFGKLVEA